MGTKAKTPWTLIISALTVLSLLAVIAYGHLLSQEYKALNSNLKKFTEESSQKNAALAELTASIGYGGLIHNFKNYILRQNDEYYAQVLSSFDLTNYWLNRLGQMLKTEEQIEQLRQISKTVQEYRSKFFIAVRYVEQGVTPLELDRIVKINDASAMSAILRLSEISKQRSDAFLKKTTIANQQYSFYLNFMVVLGVLIVLVGITVILMVQRLSAGMRLTEEAYRYVMALYDATPDALLAVSRSGHIVKANRQAETIFGYNATVLVGMQVEQLIAKSQRDAHKSMRDGYFDDPGYRPMGSGLDLKARRSDGSEIEVEISLSHHRIQEEDQAIVAIRDITRARKTERELAISLKRENRAAQFKAKLLSNMSHELRTPINQISGFSQLMLHDKDGAVNDKARKWAQEIDQSCQSLLKLVENVLSFTQKEIKRPKIKVTSIGETLRAVVIQVQQLAVYGQAEVVIIDSEDLEQVVYCARNVLEDSLQETLINALKFCDKDKPLVRISARLDDGFLAVTVMDNGTGIPEAVFEEVFKPFERLNAFDRAIEGVGMGLTLIRQMLDASDGTIHFLPFETGACLEFRLPVSKDPF